MKEQFHNYEYDALRSEIIEHIRQIGELNKFLLIMVGGSIAWLLNQAGQLDKTTSFIGAWMPYLATIWFSAYRKDLSEAISSISNYIKKIEEYQAIQGLGWEKSAREQDGIRIKMFNRTKVVYALLPFFTMFFAVYYIIRYSIGVEFFLSIIS
jgi:hypothetical protein